MINKTILLVEDNPDDVELAQRALKKNNIKNDLVVARDGVEALDYLYGTGAYKGRHTNYYLWSFSSTSNYRKWTVWRS